MSGSKLISAAEAANLVEDGVTLGVGGVMDQMAPIGFLLELLRRPVQELHAVTVAAGLGIDLLLAARCLSELSCAIVSFEDLGSSKVFRRRVEAGEVTFHEYSELTMITRLSAAMSGVPFLPTRAALGTDIARLHLDDLRQVRCPFTGAPLLACRALQPDVTVIHAHEADRSGNVRLTRKHIWHDIVLARAARRVIATVERIVEEEETRAEPERTVLPAFAVDAVVEMPAGAWPTGCRGFYESDRDVLRRWLGAPGGT